MVFSLLRGGVGPTFGAPNTAGGTPSNSTISRAPYITNPWLPDGRLNVPYSASINFTGTANTDGSGGVNDAVITIDPTTPIAPLTIGTSGAGSKYRITGTVTTDTTIPVKVNISNQYGSSTKTFSIRFRADESSLTGTPVAEYGPVLRLYRGASINAVGSTLICDPAKWQLENYLVNNEYNIQREWAWYRNGSYLHAGVIHTITSADVGATLFCRETAYRATSTGLTATQDSQVITVASGSLDSTLVYPTNLSFVGAFKSPDAIEIYYGGMGLAFNSANTSLYISKGAGAATVAEITIPTGLNPAITTFASLPNYALIQPVTDATEGGITAAVSAGQISGGGATDVVGLAVYGGRLIIDAGNQYALTQTVTHWSRPLSFATTGNVLGPATVSNATYTNPRWSTGPMALIPADKVSVNYFGSNGKVLVGWAPESTLTLDVSGGPSVFAFDPSVITGTVAVSSNSVLTYTQDAPIDTHWYNGGDISNGFQPVYGLTTLHYGVVFPNGTNTILFIGKNGHGYTVYGDPSNPPGSPWIYDPHGAGFGEHAYPWYPQIWAYDARELKAAYDAGQPSETVKPYAIWNFDWPTTGATQDVYGAAYDPATKRLYISVASTNFKRAMIYVYEVTNATTPGGPTLTSAPSISVWRSA